jgi:hypothetical protein
VRRTWVNLRRCGAGHGGVDLQRRGAGQGEVDLWRRGAGQGELNSVGGAVRDRPAAAASCVGGDYARDLFFLVDRSVG